MLWDSFSHLLHNRMEPFKFHSPTSIAIYTPPYSGKSTLTRKILEHGDELFTTPPSFTVYCYKEWLLMFDKMVLLYVKLNPLQNVSSHQTSVAIMVEGEK